MGKNCDENNIKNRIRSSGRSQLLLEEQWGLGIPTNPKGRPSLRIVEKFLQMGKENYVNHTKERYFVLCTSCLWCASCFDKQVSFLKCPICYEGVIKHMPIGEDETAVSIIVTQRALN